jgi:hypothetical protein
MVLEAENVLQILVQQVRISTFLYQGLAYKGALKRRIYNQ